MIKVPLWILYGRRAIMFFGEHYHRRTSIFFFNMGADDFFPNGDFFPNIDNLFGDMALNDDTMNGTGLPLMSRM
jgi:hypothetical protein